MLASMATTPDKPQRFRAPDDLWEQFDCAAKMVDSDRSKLLRQFMAWFVHRPNSHRPVRPDTAPPAADE